MTFDPQKVDELAAEIQAWWRNDDGCTYRVKHNYKSMGNSIIQIFDKDGVFVGNI